MHAMHGKCRLADFGIHAGSKIPKPTKRLQKYRFSSASQNAGKHRTCDPDPGKVPRVA